MKKTIALLLLLILLLGGCENNTPPIKDPSVEDTDTKDSITQDPSEENSELLSDSAFWIPYGDTAFPLSIVVDGEQQLMNDDDEWYYEYTEEQGFVMPEGMKGFDSERIYEDISPFNTPLANHPVYTDFLPGREVFVEGDFDPFVLEVDYTIYQLGETPENPLWTDYFDHLVADLSPNLPVVYKESWIFDQDGDGKNEAYINVNNSTYQSNLTQKIPIEGSTYMYDYSVYFDDDGNGYILGASSSFIDTHPIGLSIPGKGDVSQSFTIDENSPNHVDQYVGVFQTGEDGSVDLYGVFSYGEFDRMNEMRILLADIDGDGRSELITLRPQIYAPITVYKFKEDGSLERQFGIYSPA